MNLEVAHEVTRMYVRTCRESHYENVFTTFVRGVQNRYQVMVCGVPITLHSKFVEYIDSNPIVSEQTLVVTTPNMMIKNMYARLTRGQSRALYSSKSSDPKPLAYLFDVNDGIPICLQSYEYEVTGDPALAEDEMIIIRLGWESATVIST